MKEYICKDDVISGLNGWAYETAPSPMSDTLLRVAEAIERMQTADVVEVVRCGQCKHSDKRCDHVFCYEHDIEMYEDDFCSYGERKENE